MKKRVLIIDDDTDMCILLSRLLNKNGYETETAHSGLKGIAKCKETVFDIVLCDYRLGDNEGKDVLQEVKQITPETIVLIITGYSDIKTAVEVIKLGAYDYITKPLIPDEVLNVLSTALKQPEQNAVKSAGAGCYFKQRVYGRLLCQHTRALQPDRSCSAHKLQHYFIWRKWYR